VAWEAVALLLHVPSLPAEPLEEALTVPELLSVGLRPLVLVTCAEEEALASRELLREPLEELLWEALEVKLWLPAGGSWASSRASSRGSSRRMTGGADSRCGHGGGGLQTQDAVMVEEGC
jgi:hypothetical protein